MGDDDARAADENGMTFAVGTDFCDLFAERGEFHVHPRHADDFPLAENRYGQARHQHVVRLSVDVGLDEALLFPVGGNQVIVELPIHGVVVVLKHEFTVLPVGEGNISMTWCIRSIGSEAVGAEDGPDSKIIVLLPQGPHENLVMV
jgi:hypothetical protein